MVGTIAIAKYKARPFENQTIQNPILKKSGFQIPTVPQKGLYTDASPVWVSSIQIPTVIKKFTS